MNAANELAGQEPEVVRDLVVPTEVHTQTDPDDPRNPVKQERNALQSDISVDQVEQPEKVRKPVVQDPLEELRREQSNPHTKQPAQDA